MKTIWKVSTQLNGEEEREFLISRVGLIGEVCQPLMMLDANISIASFKCYDSLEEINSYYNSLDENKGEEE